MAVSTISAMASKAELANFAKALTISDATDLNTLTSSGIYYLTNATDNRPVATSGYWVVLAISSWCQIATRANNSDYGLYYRTRHTSGWGAWKLIQATAV